MYNRDWKLVAVSLKRDGLFPAVEWPRQEDSVAAVVPGEFGEDVDILGDGFVVGIAEWKLSALIGRYYDAW